MATVHKAHRIQLPRHDDISFSVSKNAYILQTSNLLITYELDNIKANEIGIVLKCVICQKT